MKIHSESQRPELSFLSAVLFGLAADQIYYVALSWYAVQMTTSNFQASIIISAGALPRLLLLLPLGKASDSIGHRRLNVLSAILRTCLMAAAAAMAAIGPFSAATLLIVSLAFGVIEAAYLPSIQSLAGVIPCEDSERLAAKFSATQKVGMAIGPALAGYLVANTSTPGLYAVIATISAATLALTLAIPKTPKVNADAATIIKKQHHFMTAEQVAVLLFIAVAEFVAGGLMNTALPMLAQGIGWPTELYGILLSIFGIGSAIGAVATTRAAKDFHLEKQPLISTSMVCCFGFLVIAIGGASSSVASLAGSAIAGLSAGALSTVLFSCYVVESRGTNMGFMMSLLSIASFGAAPLSALLCGCIADAMGNFAPFVILPITMPIASILVKAISRKE